MITIESHEDWVRSALFDPDGKSIYSGSKDNTLRRFNFDLKMN